MDIGIFDHYEEDGQLSFLGFQEYDDGIWTPEEQDVVPAGDGGPGSGEKGGARPGEGNVEKTALAASVPEGGGMSGCIGIRIGSCACCGRLLLVEEQGDSYRTHCGSCGVTYIQKK